MVIAQIEAKQKSGAFACLIIHPITMYLCDAFKSAERILDVIAKYQSRTISELGAGASDVHMRSPD